MAKKAASNAKTSAPAIPRIRGPYDPNPVRRGDFEPSLTKQSFSEEVNINSIMRRFTSTGLLSHLNHAQPRYMDCTGQDFREALETLRNASESFSELPSDIRAQFANDPAKLLDFVQDESNREKAIELGILPAEPAAQPRETAQAVENTATTAETTE